MRMLITILLAMASLSVSAKQTIVVGSKTFTESYLLAELMSQVLEQAGYAVDRRFGFGGTLVCYEALRRGDIDLYPEYTGTINQVILGRDDQPSLTELNRRLEDRGVEALDGFGFNNTYALVVPEALAAQLGLRRISDLLEHPELKLGFSHEFRNRQDGWPGLVRTYGLALETSGIEHGLAYQAINERKLDVTDAYSTDGDLLRYRLVVLEDDRSFFPEYLAVPLINRAMPSEAVQTLSQLAGKIDEQRMRALNAAVVIEGKSFADAASTVLPSDAKNAASTTIPWRSLAKNTVRHLKLTGIALVLACLVGVMIAVATYSNRRISSTLLYVAGLMQTIPSIALLALLIPLAGVGQVPAIIALFLYSLLPILRSSITALRTIDPLLRRVAAAIGLTRRQQIRHVFLPLALPHVLAGMRTAAVISIGTATLAAFIGAGGLGEPIVTGLALNDTRLILQGAIPAALPALATELAFELLERGLVPAHMSTSALPV